MSYKIMLDDIAIWFMCACISSKILEYYYLCQCDSGECYLCKNN